MTLQIELGTDNNDSDYEGQSSHASTNSSFITLLLDGDASNAPIKTDYYDTGSRSFECDSETFTSQKCEVMPTNQENVCCVGIDIANLKDGSKPDPCCWILWQSHILIHWLRNITNKHAVLLRTKR